MKRPFLALAALLISASMASAQTGGVRGKIQDEKGDPLEAVAVKMEFQGGVTLAFESKTNKKGEFMQIGLRPGNWKFTYTKEGFQVFAAPFRISLGEATVLPATKLFAAKAGGAGAGGGEDLAKAFADGVAKVQANDFDGAIAAFDAIIAKNPSISEAYYNKAFALVQKKDLPAAEPVLVKALELRPDYSDARNLLANVYTAQGKKDKAVELMQASATSADPKQLISLGETLVNNGDWPKATETFLKAEALDPKNTEVQYYLGTAALMNGKNDECAERLEKYLAGSPTNEQKKATASGMLAACKKK